MIVDEKRLNRYMSSPQWTNDQQLAARDVLDGLESTLESTLMTFITPRPMVESAAVLTGGLVPGQQVVATRHPVATVTTLDGVAVDAPPADALPGFGQPLPDGWSLIEHRMRRTPATPGTASGYGASVEISALTGLPRPGTSPARITGYVTLSYLAGWGDVPALRKAIMDKAKAIMFNTHDDSVAARNMDATKAPYVQSEDWTEAELAKLGTFRNLAAYR